MSMLDSSLASEEFLHGHAVLRGEASVLFDEIYELNAALKSRAADLVKKEGELKLREKQLSAREASIRGTFRREIEMGMAKAERQLGSASNSVMSKMEGLMHRLVSEEDCCRRRVAVMRGKIKALESELRQFRSKNDKLERSLSASTKAKAALERKLQLTKWRCEKEINAVVIQQQQQHALVSPPRPPPRSPARQEDPPQPGSADRFASLCEMTHSLLDVVAVQLEGRSRKAMLSRLRASAGTLLSGFCAVGAILHQQTLPFQLRFLRVGWETLAEWPHVTALSRHDLPGDSSHDAEATAEDLTSHQKYLLHRFIEMLGAGNALGKRSLGGVTSQTDRESVWHSPSAKVRTLVGLLVARHAAAVPLRVEAVKLLADLLRTADGRSLFTVFDGTRLLSVLFMVGAQAILAPTVSVMLSLAQEGGHLVRFLKQCISAEFFSVCSRLMGCQTAVAEPAMETRKELQEVVVLVLERLARKLPESHKLFHTHDLPGRLVMWLRTQGLSLVKSPDTLKGRSRFLVLNIGSILREVGRKTADWTGKPPLPPREPRM